MSFCPLNELVFQVLNWILPKCFSTFKEVNLFRFNFTVACAYYVGSSGDRSNGLSDVLSLRIYGETSTSSSICAGELVLVLTRFLMEICSHTCFMLMWLESFASKFYFFYSS